MYTVYDRIFGDSLPKILYIHRIYMVLANPMYAHCTVRIRGVRIASVWTP